MRLRRHVDALGVCGGDCTADIDADGICDDVDDCIGAIDACGVCNGQGTSTSAGVLTSLKAIATAMATNSMPSAFAAAIARLTTMRMASATTWMIAWVRSTRAACNGAGTYECGCAGILKATAIATETKKTLWASAAVIARLTTMRMASATMLMTAWVRSTRAACATAQETSTIADVLTFLKATATVTETKKLWAFAVVIALKTSMDGICDDVDDCVGALDACGICNGPGEIYECGCVAIPEGNCDCDGNQLDATGVCGGNCTEDADADGVCDDVDPCVGSAEDCCTDYNQNGLCDAEEVVGCTFSGAQNYDPTATMDNGTCIEACEGDLNGDGLVQLTDLLDFLLLFGVNCE